MLLLIYHKNNVDKLKTFPRARKAKMIEFFSVVVSFLPPLFSANFLLFLSRLSVFDLINNEWKYEFKEKSFGSR